MAKVRVERIATHNETGRRYLVTRIDFSQNPPMVYVDEICAAEQRRNGWVRFTTVKGIKKFPKADVAIKETRITWELAEAMWREYHEANGETVVTNRAGNLVLKRNQEIQRQRRANRKWARETVDRMFGMSQAEQLASVHCPRPTRAQEEACRRNELQSEQRVNAWCPAEAK